MSVFSFYKFHVKPLPKQTELTFPDTMSSTVHNEQESIFGELFNDKSLDLWSATRKKDGSYDIRTKKEYNNEILARSEGIIVMTIEANKQKTTIVDKHKIKHPHNPYAFLIIDYRKGQNLIALQKNNAFTKTEAFVEIIANSFNRLLEPYEHEIELKLLKKEGLTFWEAVTEIRKRHNDKVRRISLDFSNVHEEVDHSANSAVTIFSNISQKLNANTLMVLESKDDVEVDLEQVHEDMLMLADICMKQPLYELNVHFFSYGVYRFGTDVSAQFGVDEYLINNFVNHIEEPDMFGYTFTLNQWLVRIKELFENQNYVESSIATTLPKQSRRR